jgi:hypothetical protein
VADYGPLRRRLGAWAPLCSALLWLCGCFMEGYASYSDGGSADAAPVGEPLPDATGPARDSGDGPDGDDPPDGPPRGPTSDGAITLAMDAAAGGADSGRDSGGDGGSEEMDGASALDAPAGDGSNSSLGDARAGDTASEGATDSGGGCTGQAACAPECTTSPCALDCADAGTCNVTCQADQVCDIACASAGTCNVTCRPGARCSTLCTNIQFCPVDCQLGANCRNSCTTGTGCGFSSCTRDLKECGLRAACGGDASC